MDCRCSRTIQPRNQKGDDLLRGNNFLENKEEEKSPKNTILRKGELRKSSQVLTKPLKGKRASKTGSTMRTSGGSTYRKSDFVEAKIHLH